MNKKCCHYKAVINHQLPSPPSTDKYQVLQAPPSRQTLMTSPFCFILSKSSTWMTSCHYLVDLFSFLMVDLGARVLSLFRTPPPFKWYISTSDYLFLLNSCFCCLLVDIRSQNFQLFWWLSHWLNASVSLKKLKSSRDSWRFSAKLAWV